MGLELVAKIRTKTEKRKLVPSAGFGQGFG
jgi:hypothetical protein